MHEIDISIVIVNYNVKELLLQCLRSIEHTKGNLQTEIIVVDNHSIDGSVSFLSPLFPYILFIELHDNYGFSKANNIGIKQSKGKYVLILNPDTILEENTLSVMYEYMESHKEVGLAGCKVLNPDGTFQLACRRGFPTPWASFCKLFGFQKMFPKSKFFAKYNQTFRDENETYYIEAVMGAFMFVRKEIMDKIGGFDEDYFMYGEDIDICWKIMQDGWKNAYVNTTSIIHFKGESTRRSSVNEVKLLYKSMEIFAKKHYSGSFLFLLFLRIGIALRSVIARIIKYRRDIVLILIDLVGINISIIIGTKIRFGDYFNFPPYAYPTVFIAVSIVLFFSMVAVGEYFESKPTIRKSIFALMISFFILSSLTYFFNEYAFSRGVLLMTIGFTSIISAGFRLILGFLRKFKGKEAYKRIAIVGMNSNTLNIVNSLQSGEIRNVDIEGIITGPGESLENSQINLPILGNVLYLQNIIEEYDLQEIIITDSSIEKNELMKIISGISKPSVRFHIAQEYEEVLTSGIIEEISGVEPTLPIFNIDKIRNRIVKRTVDIIATFFLLTIGFPVLYLSAKKKSETIKKIWYVLTGRYSLIGLYPVDNEKPVIGKTGIMGLAHLTGVNKISLTAIKNLNNYYLEHYSFSLDVDIFIKHLFRKRSGN